MDQLLVARILNTVSIYRYFFSILMAICLLILPMTSSRPDFMGSQLLDTLIRWVLWVYFVFGYQSLFTNTTNQLIGHKYLSFTMRRGILTFLMFAISSIVLGLYIWFLTRWSLLTFVPWFSEVVVSFVAIPNGLIYAIVAFLRYFWLSKDSNG